MAKWTVEFSLSEPAEGATEEEAIEDFGLALDDLLISGEWREFLRVTPANE